MGKYIISLISWKISRNFDVEIEKKISKIIIAALNQLNLCRMVVGSRFETKIVQINRNIILYNTIELEKNNWLHIINQ